MASVGTAVVEVTGDFSSFTQGVEQAGQGLLSKASGWGSAIKATIGPALIVGAVAGLAAIGDSFDSAFDRIRVGTGQTGTALEGLQGSFKNVLGQVPADMDTVADSITLISQRLGLTGKPLEDLSTQFINLSRITDTDLSANLEAASGVFNQFGFTADQQGGKLDELFRVTQQTGISFTELTGALGKGGVAFRQAGLTFEESAGLLGLLSKNGLSASDVLPSLSKSMAAAAKDGKSAQEVFKGTFDAIRDAPDDTKAAGVALDVFGAKAGPKFAALIREGKLSYEDFAKTIAEGGDTINQAASDTDDWREKLEIFKNKALVALEPIASAVFDALGRGIDAITQGLDDFSKSDAWGTIQDVAAATFAWLGENLPKIAETITGALATVVGWIEDHWPPVRDGILAVFIAVKDWVTNNWESVKDAIVGTLEAIGRAFESAKDWALPKIEADGWPALRKAIASVVDWITNTAVPAVSAAWDWITENTAKLAAYISERWESIKKAVENVVKVLVLAVAIALAPLIFIWQNAHDQILAIVVTAWGMIQLVVGTAIRVIKDIIDVVIGLLSGDWGMAWDAIKDIPMAAFEFMIGTVQLGIDAIKSIIEGVLAILAGLWSLAWSGIQAVLSAAWEAMKAAITAALDLVVGWFTEFPGRILTALGDLLSLLVQKGKDLVQGLWDGALAIWALLSAWVTGLPDAIVTAIGDVASKLLDKGKELIGGLLTGMTEKFAEVITWAAGLGSAVASAIGELGSKLWQKGVDIIQGFIDGVESMAGRAASAVAHAIPGGDLILGDTSSGVTPAGPSTPHKTATGGFFTSPQVRSIAENGAETVINRDQALRLVWNMANAPATSASSSTSGPMPAEAAGVVVTQTFNGVAGTAEELGRYAADELTWSLRTKAA